MFLAKHTKAIYSYIYLAWESNKKSFSEYSHLVQNRVQVALEGMQHMETDNSDVDPPDEFI